MASAQESGGDAGANAPTQQTSTHGDAAQSSTTTPTNQAPGEGNTQAPNTTATTAPAAPVIPATPGTVRSAPWFRDEDDWVLERFAEEPDWPWRLLIVPFNAHFTSRPKRVGNKVYQRGNRGKEAMRQRFRLWRDELQLRLNAQAGVSNAPAADSSSDEDEGEEEDTQRLGGILYGAVKGVKRRREDSDDEGPEGDDNQGRGGGDPIAVP